MSTFDAPITNREKVQQMFGVNVADKLHEAGLIATEVSEAVWRKRVHEDEIIEATHWKLRVWIGSTPPPPHVHPGGNCNNRVARLWQSAVRLHSGGHPVIDHTGFEMTFDNHRKAATVRTQAKNLGLETKLIDCVLVEIERIK